MANDIVNRVGPGFLYRQEERTGAEVPDAARAFIVARRVLDLDSAWAAVDDVAHTVPSRVLFGMLHEFQRLVDQATTWLLRIRARPIDITTEINRLQDRVARLAGALDPLISEEQRRAYSEHLATLTSAGVPTELARRVASARLTTAAFDIVEASRIAGCDVTLLAEAYFNLGATLELDWLQRQIVDLPSESHWARMAKAALREDLLSQRRRLVLAVMDGASGTDAPDELVDRWAEANADRIDRCRATFSELRANAKLDTAMLSVALHQVRELTETAT